jgi:ribosomal protein S18 acetylase RimI-like enzyme
VRVQTTGAGPTCRNILARLPHWFGIPESVEDYVTMADRSTTVIASHGSDEVGFLTLVFHTPASSEIYVMGITPEYHRRGIGRLMLNYVEALLTLQSVEFLQVKTLSSNKPDEGYDKTRAFYLANGFRPIQEFPDLWGPENPALQMMKVLGVSSPTT